MSVVPRSLALLFPTPPESNGSYRPGTMLRCSRVPGSGLIEAVLQAWLALVPGPQF